MGEGPRPRSEAFVDRRTPGARSVAPAMQGILIALSPSHRQNAWHRLFHFLAVSGSFDFVASALCAGATPLRMTGLNWGCPSRTPARHGWGSLCRVRVRLGPPPRV